MGGVRAVDYDYGQELAGILTLTQRVHLPNNWVLGNCEIGIVVQVLGRYMIIEYLALRVRDKTSNW